MKVLVTGASGFIAKKLCEKLLADGHQVVGTVRSTEHVKNLSSAIDFFQIKSIDSKADWTQSLIGVDVVVHLAARVHVMHETATDPLKEYLAVNSDGTINLAKQAEKAGVKRFIFMSTIGVNGDFSGNKSFTEKDEPSPHNMYSISKKDAEDKLQVMSQNGEMRIVIIRAPLVYGKGNRGNFHALTKVVMKGIPMPLATVHNLKSFIYVGNLVDAIAVCSTHAAAKGVYLASDGEDISTAELIKRLYRTLGRSPRLFPFPFFLLQFIAFITGKSEVLNRLVNSLTLSNSKIRQELNWKPPYTMEEGLQETLKSN